MSVRFAVISEISTKSVKENINSLKRIINHIISEKKNVELFFFPEMFITSYLNNEDINFYKDKIDFIINEIYDFAKIKEVCILFGLPKFVDDKIYIAQMIISNKGVIGEHLKTKISKRESKVYSENKAINVFEYNGIKFGIQLCYETHFPLISTIQAKLGADIIFTAFASPRESSQEKLKRFNKFLPARAYDNSVIIAGCNLISKGVIYDFPPLSFIYNRDGDLVNLNKSFNNNYCIGEVDRTLTRKFL